MVADGRDPIHNEPIPDHSLNNPPYRCFQADYVVLEPGGYVHSRHGTIYAWYDDFDSCEDGLGNSPDATFVQGPTFVNLSINQKSVYVAETLEAEPHGSGMIGGPAYNNYYGPLPLSADCIGTNMYVYGRGSQRIRFSNIHTHINSIRAQYYLASHPIDSSRHLDNESHFSGTLQRTYSEYSENQGADAYVLQTNFDISSKPWASNDLETKGWAILDAKLLLKWNVTGGFTF
jgi:hypothetical protein